MRVDGVELLHVDESLSMIACSVRVGAASACGGMCSVQLQRCLQGWSLSSSRGYLRWDIEVRKCQGKCTIWHVLAI